MASKTETGEKVNNEYGHQFKMLMPNVEGACIHCGVRIAMYSETIGWDGSDNFRVPLFYQQWLNMSCSRLHSLHDSVGPSEPRTCCTLLIPGCSSGRTTPDPMFPSAIVRHQ